MTKSLFTTAVLAAALVLPAAAQEPQPDVRIYRSWRAPNLTVVEGLFRVDPALLGTGSCRYGVQLTVRDAAGTQLTQEDWTGECPEQNGQLAAALEKFQFNVVPSTYTVEVQVYPQGEPTRRRTRILEVRGLERNPLVSDLILARSVGFVDTTKVESWTLRRGALGLQLSSQVLVRPEDPTVAYYLELYPEENVPITGAVYGVVRRQDGRELVKVKLQEVTGLTQPQPVTGTFPLAGLPQGSYAFEAQVELADTVIVRSHPFEMAGAAVTAAAENAVGWFGTLSDEQLAELFDPVVVWLEAFASPAEAARYPTLPPQAQRVFLAQQFGTQGPTPDDDEESAIDSYLNRVRTVNQRFAERSGRGTQAAWRTDRGRIFLLMGEPSAQVTRPSPASRAPYEIWQYSVGQGLVYLFADDTRMGHYRLIYTNDPNRQSAPGWADLVASEAQQDLARLGFRPAGGATIPPQQDRL